MNKAKELLEEIRLRHFNDDMFARIPSMTVDERREYMLTKLDRMVCVDYEIPSIEDLFYTFLRMSDETGECLELLKELPLERAPKDVSDILKSSAENSPDLLWSRIWEDPACGIGRNGCPFFCTPVLDELTEEERQQVTFILDFTQCFGAIEMEDFVPLYMIIPDCKREDEDYTPWSPIDDFNFHPDQPLEQFITTTPHRRLAAALAHVVLSQTVGEIEHVGKEAEGELKTWCKACSRFLKDEEYSAWMNFSSAFLPARQYIARAHTLMHTAELDYHLTEILEQVERL